MMTMRIGTLTFIMISLLCHEPEVESFVLVPRQQQQQSSMVQLELYNNEQHDMESTTTRQVRQQQQEQPPPPILWKKSTSSGTTTTSRRNVLVGAVTAAVSFRMVLATPTSVSAADAATIPLITTEEFDVLIRQSAQAISVVEFSGPKSETVTVKLRDGSSFGLSDVVESPVDPRSPLKIAATCRENRIPTQFVSLQAALQSAPKRNVVYTNERVLQAAEKEKAKQRRIEQDELAQLYQIQEQQAAAAARK